MKNGIYRVGDDPNALVWVVRGTVINGAWKPRLVNGKILVPFDDTELTYLMPTPSVGSEDYNDIIDAAKKVINNQ